MDSSSRAAILAGPRGMSHAKDTYNLEPPLLLLLVQRGRADLQRRGVYERHARRRSARHRRRMPRPTDRGAPRGLPYRATPHALRGGQLGDPGWAPCVAQWQRLSGRGPGRPDLLRLTHWRVGQIAGRCATSSMSWPGSGHNQPLVHCLHRGMAGMRTQEGQRTASPPENVPPKRSPQNKPIVLTDRHFELRFAPRARVSGRGDDDAPWFWSASVEGIG